MLAGINMWNTAAVRIAAAGPQSSFDGVALAAAAECLGSPGQAVLLVSMATSASWQRFVGLFHLSLSGCSALAGDLPYVAWLTIYYQDML